MAWHPWGGLRVRMLRAFQRDGEHVAGRYRSSTSYARTGSANPVFGTITVAPVHGSVAEVASRPRCTSRTATALLSKFTTATAVWLPTSAVRHSTPKTSCPCASSHRTARFVSPADVACTSRIKATSSAPPAPPTSTSGNAPAGATEPATSAPAIGTRPAPGAAPPRCHSARPQGATPRTPSRPPPPPSASETQPRPAPAAASSSHLPPPPPQTANRPAAPPPPARGLAVHQRTLRAGPAAGERCLHPGAALGGRRRTLCRHQARRPLAP